MQLALFWITAVVSVISALLVVFNKNVVYSALMLLINFATIAIFFFMLNAQFLGVVQILVYAGAIVVLFLFVVMLLGSELGEDVGSWATPRNGIMVLLGLVLLTVLGTSVELGPLQLNAPAKSGNFTTELIAEYGQSQLIGGILYTDYLFTVQLAGVLLLVGIVGVIWLARTERGTYLFDKRRPYPRQTLPKEPQKSN